MRVSLGFEPAWYHQRCGVDFSKQWHNDPRIRHDALVAMKTELCRAFPTVSYWNLDHRDDLWTLSGAYGAFVIPAVFGCTLRYWNDRWPLIETRPESSLQELAELAPDDLLSGPVVRQIFEQMEIIESEWGRIHGYLNWQGVLNNAFNVYGQAVFEEMMDRPELVHQFFSLITDVMIGLAQRVQKRQRQSDFYHNHLCVSNCVMNMLSPRAYREFLFPYDKRIAESFERFGVHTCNWDVTPYLSELRQLPRVGYLDMGMMSDMRKVREVFPEVRRAVLYSPVKLNDAPLDEIQADLLRIYQELSPCDVVLADIQSCTPDARIHDVLRICHCLEEGAI